MYVQNIFNRLSYVSENDTEGTNNTIDSDNSSTPTVEENNNADSEPQNDSSETNNNEESNSSAQTENKEEAEESVSSDNLTDSEESKEATETEQSDNSESAKEDSTEEFTEETTAETTEETTEEQENETDIDIANNSNFALNDVRTDSMVYSLSLMSDEVIDTNTLLELQIELLTEQNELLEKQYNVTSCYLNMLTAVILIIYIIHSVKGSINRFMVKNKEK